MENCKISGKSQGILRWMISGSPEQENIQQLWPAHIALLLAIQLGHHIAKSFTACSSDPKFRPEQIMLELSPNKALIKTAGPGCSKLTRLLVNEILKFQTLISLICQYFLWKKCEKLLLCKSFSHFFNQKCEKLLHCNSFSHFFNQKYQCIWLWSCKTLNKLTS